MSEKTMVTIDRDLIIPEGTEKVFENQHIQIDATVEVSGSLVFRNCTIEQSNNGNGEDTQKPWYVYIQSDGKLEMDGCEIIHPRRSFLYGDNMTITNTSFVFEPSPDIVISVNKNCTFAGCTFLGEGKAGESDNESFRGQMSCRNAVVENCTFQNINAAITIEAISDCSFTDCGHISGLCVTSATFRNCASIHFIPITLTGRGYVKNCDFVHVESIFCQKTDVENCRFQNLLNDGSYKGILYLDNCRASDCTFSDIGLRNNSYLIFGESNASVDNCEFINCQTEREDSNLIYIEPPKKIAKGLFKGALKLAGSAALGATGIAATFLRTAGEAVGNESVINIAGMVQDKSFEKVRDMWGMDGTRKIDSMSMNELETYVKRFTRNMDEEESDALWSQIYSEIASIDGEGLDDAALEVQIKEIVKECIKNAGKERRATERAESASRNASQFNRRVEEERKKFEREHGKHE